MEVKACLESGRGLGGAQGEDRKDKRGGGAVLCGSRALCQGKGMPGKLGDRRTSLGQFLDEHLELRDTSPCG